MTDSNLNRDGDAPRVAPRGVRIGARVVLAVILLVCALMSLGRGLENRVDWVYWVEAGASVESGRIPPLGSMTYGYPPHVYILFWFLTRLLRPPTGLILFVVTSVAAMLWVIRTVGRRWVSMPPGDWPVHQLLPLVLVLAHVVNSFHHNQLGALVLFGLVLGITLVQQRREYLGGAVLGITVSIKLIPLFLLVVILTKRAWRAALTAVLAGVLFAGGLSLPWYGRDGTVQAFREWFWRVQLFSPASQAQNYPLLSPDRSQALISVLCRWLRPAADGLQARVVFDPPLPNRAETPTSQTGLPEFHTPAPPNISLEPIIVDVAPAEAWALARMGPNSVLLLYALVSAILVVTTLTVARRAAHQTSATDFYAEMSLGMLVAILLSPVLFGYYLVWAYPAWAMLATLCDSRRLRALPIVLMLIWIASQIAMASTAMRQNGVNLWAVLLLAVTLGVLRLRSGVKVAEPISIPAE